MKRGSGVAYRRVMTFAGFRRRSRLGVCSVSAPRASDRHSRRSKWPRRARENRRPRSLEPVNQIPLPGEQTKTPVWSLHFAAGSMPCEVSSGLVFRKLRITQVTGAIVHDYMSHLQQQPSPLRGSFQALAYVPRSFPSFGNSPWMSGSRSLSDAKARAQRHILCENVVGRVRSTPKTNGASNVAPLSVPNCP